MTEQGERGEVQRVETADRDPTPNPNTAAFPDLCTIKPTLLMAVRRTAEITGTRLPLTVNPLPPGGGNRGMDKRRAKKEVK